jgi:2-aminoadipate transaminase
VVTTGSQQGLDLVARVLLDPGDVALMELPSYTGAISAFRNVGATLVGVRQETDGIDLEHLDATLSRLRAEGKRVKLLYVVPNFQNPTGLLMSLAKRTAVLEWADRHRVLIVEDDPYRDIYFPDVSTEEETRPIAADDRQGMVVYLSSFSKTLAPGFRVGWVSAPPEVAGKLELSKQAEDLCTGGLDQRIVYEAWRRGLLATHVPQTARALSAQAGHDGRGDRS